MWGVVAVVLQLRATVSDDIKSLIFWLGVFMLIVIAIFVIYADVTPWFNGIWGMGGDNGGGD